MQIESNILVPLSNRFISWNL